MDFNNLWEEISDQRVLFHPTIAPDDDSDYLHSLALSEEKNLKKIMGAY